MCLGLRVICVVWYVMYLCRVLSHSASLPLLYVMVIRVKLFTFFPICASSLFFIVAALYPIPRAAFSEYVHRFVFILSFCVRVCGGGGTRSRGTGKCSSFLLVGHGSLYFARYVGT